LLPSPGMSFLFLAGRFLEIGLLSLPSCFTIGFLRAPPLFFENKKLIRFPVNEKDIVLLLSLWMAKSPFPSSSHGEGGPPPLLRRRVAAFFLAGWAPFLPFLCRFPPPFLFDPRKRLDFSNHDKGWPCFNEANQFTG